eukprot:CAMPEP_0176455772 /NCGR_PEP_ID=MMETSP0127-20121128/30840_1 /TAXON_ID=938130 /ORGANISM="Platyophrya macrostoma, Strain WH" /LENGTH=383 /DNA_ID=CAMNT_0017845501 /DNA_START=16 /DNA_END=1167 /DNA_ORIENTATION=+
MISTKFDDYLKQSWKALFESPEGELLFRSGFKYLHLRHLDKGYLALTNTAYNENKRETQIDFEGASPLNKGGTTEIKEEKTEKIVLQDFDETKFNYNEVDPNEILFYVDLEDESIITKDDYENRMFSGEDADPGKELNECHPIIANISPICPSHSLIALFPKEELPQVIGSDIIVLLLQVFKLSDAADLKVGFNSIGACAHVNHLHFHLLYAADLFKDGKFPMENAKTKPLLKSSLQSPDEQINMYSVGVIVEELEDYPVQAFKVTPADTKADVAEVFTSLSFAAGAIINFLIDLDIPHNMLIGDRGYSIYIIPRKFERMFKDFNIHASWLEIAGLAISRSKEGHQAMTAESFEKTLSTEVSLEKAEFDAIRKKITSFFAKYT